MQSNPRQLKVVPPQNIKPLIQKPSLEPPETKDSKHTPDSPKTEGKGKSKIPLNGILILGILAALGYGIFVPKIQHSVKANANVSTQEYKRARISLKEAGIIKKIRVKPNQNVFVGDVILEAESPTIKEEIAREKTELGQLESDLKNDSIAAEQAQSRLNQEEVETKSAQEELEMVAKDLRAFDAGILPQRRQMESEKIELNNQLANKKEELGDVEERLARYYKAINQNAISRDTAKDSETQQRRIKGEILQINDRLQQNEIKIALGNKELNDQLQKLTARLKEQQSQEKAALENLFSLQKRIQQTRERIDFQRTEIQRQEERQKNLVVKSEIQGTVLDSNLDQLKNRFFQAGETVIEIADLFELKGIALVRQEDYGLVEVGDEIEFYPSGKLKPYIARVESKSNKPVKKENDPKLYWEVTFSVKNDSQRTLKPDMSGYVAIQTQPMTLFEKMRHEVLKLVRQPIL